MNINWHRTYTRAQCGLGTFVPKPAASSGWLLSGLKFRVDRPSKMSRDLERIINMRCYLMLTCMDLMNKMTNPTQNQNNKFKIFFRPSRGAFFFEGPRRLRRIGNLFLKLLQARADSLKVVRFHCGSNIK